MLEIFLLFILPVCIVYLFPYFYKNRQWIFGPSLILLIVLIVVEKYSLYKLGFRIDNFYSSFSAYAILIVIGVPLTLIVAHFLNKKPIENWWKLSHFSIGFIALSFFQELVYRGYLIPKLETIFDSSLAVILINSLLFAFIHIIYPNKIRNLLLTFIAGLFFASIYYYFPNIFLITVCHSILNFFALLYGIIGPAEFNNKENQIVSD